jgi:hypothetical protein
LILLLLSPLDATEIRLNPLFFHPQFAFPLRRNPCRAHLLPHEGLEIIEERLHGGKDLQGIIGKIGLHHSLIAERVDDHELLVAQQIDLGMVRCVSSRHRLEHFPRNAAEILAKFGCLDHFHYRAGILGDGGANCLQIRRRGHVYSAPQNRSAGHDVDVVGQAQRVPAAGSQNGGKVALVGRLVLGEAHVVVDAKDGIFGSEIAQWLDGIEAEDEALDEVLEERFCLVVLGAVGFKPFVIVVLAKVVQESEDGLELGHGKGIGRQALDSFHFSAMLHLSDNLCFFLILADNLGYAGIL